MPSDGEVDREKKEKILVCEAEVSDREEYRKSLVSDNLNPNTKVSYKEEDTKSFTSRT